MILRIMVCFALALPLAIELDSITRWIARRKAEKDIREIQRMIDQIEKLKELLPYREEDSK